MKASRAPGGPVGRALEREYAPNRPVAIVPIAFGPDIEPAALQRIARATRAQAFVTRDPRQIQDVFLQMLISTICGTACPTSRGAA